MASRRRLTQLATCHPKADAVEKMAAAGDYDLAARTWTWATAAKLPNAWLSQGQLTVFLTLTEKYQGLNP